MLPEGKPRGDDGDDDDRGGGGGGDGGGEDELPRLIHHVHRWGRKRQVRLQQQQERMQWKV